MNRLRSRSDTLHRSAFFELCIHELLLRRGFKIIAIEPNLRSGRSPDFLVEAPDAMRFYVEATLASGMSDVAAGADRRMREALQAIDNVSSPDFFLHLHTRGVPTHPIAVGRLRRAVQRFVDTLDYEKAVAAAASGVPLPHFQHEENGAGFVIRPVPKRVRGRDGRAIGGRMLPGGKITPHEAIKASVEGKARHYGELDLPLLVAVNSLEEFARAGDAIDAMFGTLSVIVPDAGPVRPVRNRDGAWHGPTGPTNTRVSGILSTERLSPWDLGQRSLRLILNPWARRPLPPDIPFGIETSHVVDNHLQTLPGMSLREIFGLPLGWPE